MRNHKLLTPQVVENIIVVVVSIVLAALSLRWINAQGPIRAQYFFTIVLSCVVFVLISLELYRLTHQRETPDSTDEESKKHRRKS